MNRSPIHPVAVANIIGGNEAPRLTGQVNFYQRQGYVLIAVSIKDLPLTKTEFFGFHIHEGRSCSGNGFPKTGNHYNPESTPHPIHSGDLPPLLYCNGGAYMTVATDRFTVKEIIGRTIVIHSMADDFTSQPTGNAGTKIGCGTIDHV